VKYATEEWRAIAGREGEYEVSSLGRVRSLDRVLADGRRRKGQILAPRFGATGYVTTCLGAGNYRLVHRLVVEAFIGPIPEGQDVRHLDGSRTNNVPENLCYGTRLENMADQRRHGTHGNTVKTHCPRGHLLREPNLVALHTRGGRRYCLSCRRASSALKRRKNGYTDAELRSYADQSYSRMCIAVA